MLDTVIGDKNGDTLVTELSLLKIKHIIVTQRITKTLENFNSHVSSSIKNDKKYFVTKVFLSHA